MTRKRLFVSHVGSETELAQHLKQRLAKHFLGLLDTFVSSDRETIGAGSRWLDEVDIALKSADLQLVLCSAGSVGRPWVNFEAGAAWLRGIPVIPLCHSGMTPQTLPVPLGMLEAVECGRPDDLRKLYDAIARVLGTETPDVDFGRLVEELAEIERRLSRARAAPRTIAEPRILCAASEQYAQPDFGFQLDVDVLCRAFPGRVEVETKLTLRRLRELLTQSRYDIVHLVLAVDRDSGALIFGPLDAAGRQAAAHETLSAQGFAALLRESGTSLVVLATCRALLLGVEVAHVANMAASDADITGEAAAEWEECFYGLLADGMPLFKAFELTRTQLDTPIRPIRHADLAFSTVRSGATAAG